LNDTFSAMLFRWDSATSVPMSASTSSPVTALACWLSPGQLRISGDSARTVESSPNQPSAVSAHPSFDGAPACSHAWKTAHANSASESGSSASRAIGSPA
jgi:hypothetical protein